MSAVFAVYTQQARCRRQPLHLPDLRSRRHRGFGLPRTAVSHTPSFSAMFTERFSPRALAFTLVLASLQFGPAPAFARSGELELVPTVWSMSFRIAANTCVHDLTYKWGALRMLNSVGAAPRPRLCGGESGNGILSFVNDLPIPMEPLHITWTTESGRRCSYQVDVARLALGQTPHATRFQLSIEDSLAIQLASVAQPAPAVVHIPCP